MTFKTCTDCTHQSQCQAVRECLIEHMRMKPDDNYISYFAEYTTLAGQFRKEEFANKPMAEARGSNLLAQRPIQIKHGVIISKVTREVVRRMKP